MKVKTLFVLVVAVIVLLVLSKSFFFVLDETEQAVILQFGKPIKVLLGSRSVPHIDQLRERYAEQGVELDTAGPGLRLKTPIQEVRKLENRLLEYDDQPKKAPTAEKKYISIDNYTRWAIVDPLKFIKSVRTETLAQKKLDDIIYSNLRQQVANNFLYDIVRTTNRKIETTEINLKDLLVVDKVTTGREKIMSLITEYSDSDTRRFGVEVIDVRIKRADLPPDIKADVEKRMISERQRIEHKLRSEGEKLLIEMEGAIEQEVNRIISESERKARAIEGDADAKAIRIYADAYSKDPDFFAFLRTLESYKTSMVGKTRLVITTDSDYFELFKTIKKYTAPQPAPAQP